MLFRSALSSVAIRFRDDSSCDGAVREPASVLHAAGTRNSPALPALRIDSRPDLHLLHFGSSRRRTPLRKEACQLLPQSISPSFPCYEVRSCGSELSRAPEVQSPLHHTSIVSGAICVNQYDSHPKLNSFRRFDFMKHRLFAAILALTLMSWAQTSTQTTPSQAPVPTDKAKPSCDRKPGKEWGKGCCGSNKSEKVVEGVPETCLQRACWGYSHVRSAAIAAEKLLQQRFYACRPSSSRTGMAHTAPSVKFSPSIPRAWSKRAR